MIAFLLVQKIMLLLFVKKNWLLKSLIEADSEHKATALLFPAS